MCAERRAELLDYNIQKNEIAYLHNYYNNI